ncbi:MAG: hypothetical protein ABEI27_00230 [Halobellus sp.]|uniref:hypothetical protein n=1 Tax=Halobellus sp. TaxID=1979212 RepID=UPI0035D4BD79
MSEYVVDVKPSARRTNAAAGQLVQRSGSRHRFDSRADAETWAAGLTAQGETTVWVRTANPNDRSDVDAYLIGRRTRRHGPRTADPVGERTSEAGEQAGLDGDPLAEL